MSSNIDVLCVHLIAQLLFVASRVWCTFSNKFLLRTLPTGSKKERELKENYFFLFPFFFYIYQCWPLLSCLLSLYQFLWFAGEDGVSLKEEFARLPLKMDPPEKVLCQAYGQARPVAEFLHENGAFFFQYKYCDCFCAVKMISFALRASTPN